MCLAEYEEIQTMDCSVQYTGSGAYPKQEI